MALRKKLSGEFRLLDSLRSGLQNAVKKLLGNDIVDEAAIKEFVRDLQRALIQADVNVKLVLSVTESVQRRALEEKPPAGLTRKDQIVKILYEELDKLLGGDQELRLDRTKQNVVVMLGIQGSGKTTTLYSALSRVNTIEVNIMTAEDPVEYNIHGINQVLVRNEIGMTFAAALKAFLRQDPNIIMVGEIRDIETGGIAIKAALTGHLVLSTLHTNDAPSTVTRMIDMGIEPFNVASAVNLIVAQRLVRRICKECKQEYQYSEEELHALALGPQDAAGITFYKGGGCDTCNGTGYKGRAGLYEVMALTPEQRRLILRGASTAELQEQAVKDGMLTLRMDGIEKIRKGVTTLEEVVKETAA